MYKAIVYIGKKGGPSDASTNARELHFQADEGLELVFINFVYNVASEDLYDDEEILSIYFTKEDPLK